MKGHSLIGSHCYRIPIYHVLTERINRLNVILDLAEMHKVLELATTQPRVFYGKLGIREHHHLLLSVLA